MFQEASEKSFTEINLAENKVKKAPKRLVYFSDGILEEYSSEDEVDNGNAPDKPLVDPVSLCIYISPWVCELLRVSAYKACVSFF